MISMAMDSAKLFFAGKLFKNTLDAMLKLGLGMLLGSAALILAYLCGLSVLAAALIGGAVAGIVQPVLYKNLKYA